jgi:hypothetical protein
VEAASKVRVSAPHDLDVRLARTVSE